MLTSRQRGSKLYAVMNDNQPTHAAPVPIATDEAHVWKVRLDVADSQFRERCEMLSAEERRRAEEFRLEAPRRRFVIARSALRVLLGRYLGAAAHEISIVSNENGKPRLRDYHQGCELRFNVAHSGDVALVAITQSCEVGVDIEQLRGVRHAAQIARRYFHLAEVESIAAAPDATRDNVFLRCWTSKEAILKAVGTGITGSLSEFSVAGDADDTAPRDIVVGLRDGSSSRCWLERLNVGDGYLAAVAFVGAHRRVLVREFDW